MTSADSRITAALQHDAPPPRDPAFRLRVLERRERQQFRRRALLFLAVLAVVAATTALAITAGGRAYQAGAGLLFALLLVTAALVHLPVLGRLLHNLAVPHGPSDLTGA